MRKLLRSKKALSPVIAAIILIAVTVAVSIAVAAWMGLLTTGFMGYERLEITKVDWTWTTNRYVDITVVNTGTKDVTIKQININYAKVAAASINVTLPMQFKTTDLPQTFRVTFNYNNGTAYDISIVTTANNEFPKPCYGGIDIS